MRRIGRIETSVTTNPSCVTPEKSEDLLYTAAEIGSHAKWDETLSEKWSLAPTGFNSDLSGAEILL
jgi:hypothetical protein